MKGNRLGTGAFSAITPQSPVQIRLPQLESPVAKSAYRRVIRKADVRRRRPFFVLSPVFATTCDDPASLKVSVSPRRARHYVRPRWTPTTPLWTKSLGCLSVSRRLGYRDVASALSLTTPQGCFRIALTTTGHGTLGFGGERSLVMVFHQSEPGDSRQLGCLDTRFGFFEFDSSRSRRWHRDPQNSAGLVLWWQLTRQSATNRAAKLE